MVEAVMLYWDGFFSFNGRGNGLFGWFGPYSFISTQLDGRHAPIVVVAAHMCANFTYLGCNTMFTNSLMGYDKKYL